MLRPACHGRTEAVTPAPAAVAPPVVVPPPVAAAPPVAVATAAPSALPAPTASAETVRSLDAREVAALIRRGQDLLASGGRAVARLLLMRGRGAGCARGLAGGTTYDPALLRQIGADGPLADPRRPAPGISGPRNGRTRCPAKARSAGALALISTGASQAPVRFSIHRSISLMMRDATRVASDIREEPCRRAAGKPVQRSKPGWVTTPHPVPIRYSEPPQRD